ncbi:unnamed protein product [Schistosoma mattheei]|uniref:Uncharacterized protein n=1 Tax=Schistosoma mattheei TaxID=31246 RepID=A0A183NNC8_9TREM|nr:unnamed protein product [Schistosoma mattheei]
MDNMHNLQPLDHILIINLCHIQIIMANIRVPSLKCRILILNHSTSILIHMVDQLEVVLLFCSNNHNILSTWYHHLQAILLHLLILRQSLIVIIIIIIVVHHHCLSICKILERDFMYIILMMYNILQVVSVYF